MYAEMKPSLEIRGLRASDLAAADELRQAAGWNQPVVDWRRILALNPKGCFLAAWDGKKIGTLTTTRYGGDVAWIGMVLVDPSFRRRGVANDLLKHAIKYLKAENVKCIKLDATPQGQPLYKNLGFKPEMHLHRWEWRGAAGDLLKHRVPRDIFLRELELADLPKVRALDERISGADRGRLLQTLLAGAIRATVWDLYSDIESYGMIRPGVEADYLGPVISTSEHHAHLLIRDLISRSRVGRIYWDIPDCNEKAKEIAESIGFEVQRPLVRMYAGRNMAKGIPESVYAISDPSTG